MTKELKGNDLQATLGLGFLVPLASFCGAFFLVGVILHIGFWEGVEQKRWTGYPLHAPSEC